MNKNACKARTLTKLGKTIDSHLSQVAVES
jgi:hypothetical protein